MTATSSAVPSAILRRSLPWLIGPGLGMLFVISCIAAQLSLPTAKLNSIVICIEF